MSNRTDYPDGSNGSREGEEGPAVPNEQNNDGRERGRDMWYDPSVGRSVVSVIIFVILLAASCRYVLRRFCFRRRRRRSRGEFAVGENGDERRPTVLTELDIRRRLKTIEASLVTRQVVPHEEACDDNIKKISSENEVSKDNRSQLTDTERDNGEEVRQKHDTTIADKTENNEITASNNSKEDISVVIITESTSSTLDCEGNPLSSNATTNTTQDDTNHNEDTGILCHICLEYLQVGDDVSWAKDDDNYDTEAIEKKCQHAFHNECIVEWLRRRDDCPCCRRPILLPPNPQCPAPDGDGTSSVYTRQRCSDDDVDEEKGMEGGDERTDSYAFCVVHGVVRTRYRR